jgi:hydroxyacylglutathione hydrolase
LLGTVQPDIVISSAFGGETAVEAVDTRRWSQCIEQALASVPS